MVKTLSKNERQALLDKTKENIATAGSKEAGLELTRNQLRESGIAKQVKDQFVAGGGVLNKPEAPVEPVAPVQPVETPKETPVAPVAPTSTTETIKPPVTTTPPVKTETTKVETPKTEAPQSIAEWKAQGSDMSTLETMIEDKYGTIATNENGVLTANIGGQDYQWNIDDAGNPIKTKIQVPTNSQDIFSQLVSGQQIQDANIRNTPEYQKADKRYQDYSNYSKLNASELSVALQDGLVLPGTQLYKDLSSNPEIKARLDEAVATNKINGKDTNLNKSGETNTENILNDATIENYMSDNNISVQEFNNLTTSPELISKGKEVEQKQLEVNELQATYDDIRRQTEAEFKGTGASKVALESLIASRQADIRPALNLAKNNLATIYGTYTDMKTSNIDLFKTNLGLYQNAQTAKAEAQALKDKRAYDEAKISTTIITDASTGKQKLINSVTGETIKEYDTGLAGSTTKAPEIKNIGTSDEPNWVQYNAATGSYDPITTSGFTGQGTPSTGSTVTSGTTRNRPDRNNNPGNVKLAQGQNISSIIGAVGQDDQGHLIFDTAQNGYNHMIKDITAKLTGGSRYVTPNSTLADLAKVYAEDPNWGASVSKMSGYPLNTKLSQIDVNKLAPAIVKQEGFTGSISQAPQKDVSTEFKNNSIPQYTNYLTSGKIGTNKDELAAIVKEFGSIEAFKAQAEAYNNSENGPRRKELDKIKALKDKVSDIISEDNSEALSNSVGTSQFTIGLTPQRRKKEAYLASIESFLAGKTLQELINVKADGATFGALSNEELRMLQNSASELNQLANREKDNEGKETGKIIGFNGSEQNFKDKVQETIDLYSELIAKKERLIGEKSSTQTGNTTTGKTGKTYTW